MQFSLVAAIALAATTVSAWGNSSVAYTTVIETEYTTYCPEATQLTYNNVVYTVTSAQVLTITNCPCTIVKPITTASSVAPTTPVYANTSAPAPTKAPAPSTPAPLTTSGGNKAFILSGASLAGLLGLAAYVL